ncbi:MAG: DNA polymerase III subunit beta [Anaerolineales bacterium]|nr:DNA polymerase III subunit beta [Anaerolineales bacterium]
MKIKVERDVFLEALKIVAPGVSAKSTLPVLACVKLETSRDEVSLATTNLDLSLYTALPASVIEGGAAVVDHALLGAVIEKMRANTVTLIVDENKSKRITVQSDDGTVHLKGVSVDEFAAMPVVLTENTTTVAISEWFKSAVNSVAFAAADDDTRPTLTGVYLVGADDKVTLAATNGFILAQWQGETAVSWPDVKVNIPARHLKEIIRVMEPTSITFNCELVVFESATVRAVLRTLEGNYPNYNEIIKPPVAAALRAQKPELAVACGLALVIAVGKDATTKMSYESDMLVLEASFSDRGENASVCRATVDDSASVTAVTLSAHLMNDIVSHVPGQEVVVRVPDSGMEPIVFLCADEPAWMAVQMPMLSK